MFLLPQHAMSQPEPQNPVEKVKFFAQSLKDNTQAAIAAIQKSLNSKETAAREFDELIRIINEGLSNLGDDSDIWQHVAQLIAEYEKNAKEAAQEVGVEWQKIAKKWQERKELMVTTRGEIIRLRSQNEKLVGTIKKKKKLVVHYIMLQDADAAIRAMQGLVKDMNSMQDSLQTILDNIGPPSSSSPQ